MKQQTTTSQDAQTGSYLLNIYRRSNGEDARLVGTLEKLGDNEKQTFGSPEELLKLLGVSDSAPEKRGHR